MTPSAVVFDVGNVLIEWDRNRLYDRLIPDAGARHEFFETVLTMEVNLALDAGAPFDETLESVALAHPGWRAEVLAFGECWGETLGDHDDAMVALIDELSAGGVEVFALTNFSHETWPIALSRHPWLMDLSGIVVSGFEGIVKPDPAIYELLLGRYSLDAATTWFTDDNLGNVEAAIVCGLQAELFLDAPTCRSQLIELGLLSS